MTINALFVITQALLIALKLLHVLNISWVYILAPYLIANSIMFTYSFIKAFKREYINAKNK